MEWKMTPDRKILTWGGLDKSRGSRGEVLAQSVKWSGRQAYSRPGSRPADQTTPQQKPRFVTEKHYTEVPAHRLSLPGPKTTTKRPGLFTSQKQAREASLVQVHLNAGDVQGARRQADKAKIMLPLSVEGAVQGTEEWRGWRSNWSAFTPRRRRNVEASMLHGSIRDYVKKDRDYRDESIESASRAEKLEGINTAIGQYHDTVCGLKMWKLTLEIAWKSKRFNINVDGEFSLELLKHEIKRLEGLHPEVQRLYVLPRALTASRGDVLAATRSLTSTGGGGSEHPGSSANLLTDQSFRSMDLFSSRQSTAFLSSTGGGVLQGNGLGDSLVSMVGVDNEGAGENLSGSGVGEVYEMTDDEANISEHYGVGPNDLIMVEIDPEKTRAVTSRILSDLFGGVAEGWKFETTVLTAFQRTDLDGGGTLDSDELRMAFENMEIFLTTDQVDAMVDEFDSDGSGTFDQQEFRDMVIYLMNNSI